MLTKDDVVYDLQVEKGKPVLRFIEIATRRRISHDAGAELEDIPELFVPVSASGMAQAVWQASVLPMKAMGAMTDSGYYALEDIDRLDALRKAARSEEIQNAFNEIMADLAARAAPILEESGAYRGPTPPWLYHAYKHDTEMKRRIVLAEEKMRAAEDASTPA